MFNTTLPRHRRNMISRTRRRVAIAVTSCDGRAPVLSARHAPPQVGVRKRKSIAGINMNISAEYPIWRRFIEELRGSPEHLSQEHISSALSIFNKLTEELNDISPFPVPTTAPIKEGIGMWWGKGRYMFEIIVLPNGNLEWFYRDRETDELDGTEDEPESTISTALISRLRFTIENSPITTHHSTD